MEKTEALYFQRLGVALQLGRAVHVLECAGVVYVVEEHLDVDMISTASLRCTRSSARKHARVNGILRFTAMVET